MEKGTAAWVGLTSVPITLANSRYTRTALIYLHPSSAPTLALLAPVMIDYALLF